MVETLQQHAYDPEGNLLEARDPNRHVKLGYEHFHRVAWREEDGTRLRFEYDTEDRVVALINEAGERYEIEHDPLGRRTREHGFDGATWECVRDRSGLPVRVVTPRGTSTVNQYDLLGRLVGQIHSDGTFVRFEYGPDDQVERATNELTEVLLERDVLGRVVRERVGDVEITSHYDLNGERIELRSSIGARESISRDSLGLPRAIHYGSPNGFHEADVVFERDARGLEIRRRFPAVEIAWGRDGLGRPTSRHVRTGSTSVRGAKDLLASTYQWRGDDQLTAILDATRGPRTFDHDRRGRVVRESTPTSTTHRFVDPVGNIYSSRGGSDRQYGPGGRLTSAGNVRFDYDQEGRRRSASSQQGLGQYIWNEHGQLTRVVLPDGGTVTYEYDAFSRRTVRRRERAGGTTEETRFVWDGHTVVHELSSETGLTTWHWSPETFTPLAKERQGRLHSIGTDQNGTPCEIFDETGMIVWKATVDIGGTWTFDIGDPDDCPWRWPGQHADTTTGLAYNRFRWFDASTSTYLTPDPIRLEGGPSLYGYVNDPNWHADPFGLDTHIGDAGERAATRWLEAGNNRVLGGIQNSSGHGIDLVYVDPTGRVCVAEVKANSAILSAAQARGADSFGRSRLRRSARWRLDAAARRARQALATWVAANPSKRITGLVIYTEVNLDAAGRARGTVTSSHAWTAC
jgi:RHS repeat-associated protein